MKPPFLKSAMCFAVIAVAAAAYPVSAHHSTAMFDAGQTLPLAGTVKELHWANPHVTIFIENTDTRRAPAGVWAIELASPSKLVRSGWSPTAVKPGDKVALDVHPLRDGTKGAALRRITLTDTGQSYAYNIRDLERPNLAQLAR